MPIIGGGSGSGGGGAGAVSLLNSVTLGANGTFDVSGISQAATDLILSFIVRGADVGAGDTLLLRFNNDSTGGHYSTQMAGGFGTTATASADNTTGAIKLDIVANGGTPATAWSVLEVVVPGYKSTTWEKSIVVQKYRIYGAATTNQDITVVGGIWLSTSAITRVQALGTTTANLVAGSTLRIYGRT